MTTLQLNPQPLLLCAVQHASGATAVTVQARLADADVYLGESTSLELRINGIRNHELDGVFCAPSSRYWHTGNGSPLLFMAHLLFL